MCNRIDSLQWLRAIAAIWVLITHVYQHLGLKPLGYGLSGQWGVDIFFILSGFIIFYTTNDGGDWKRFVLKRLLRIYPLYLFCLLVYSIYYHAANNLNLDFWGWIQNILMVPFMDTIGFHSLLVAQAWSTCYEMYFYSVFAIFLFWGVKKKWLLPSLSVLMIVGMILTITEVASQYGVGRFVVSLIGSRYIIMFCLGVAISTIYKKCPSQDSCKPTGHLLDKQTAGRVMIIFLIFLLYICTIISKYNFCLSVGVSTVVFVACLYSQDMLSKTGMLNRVMIKLGDISFSIYLVHILIIKLLISNGIDSFYSLLFMSLTVTVAVSLMTYHLIEQPFIKIAKRNKSK